MSGGATYGVQRLSVPVRVKALPQVPTALQRQTLVRVADLLVPGSTQDPKASDLPDLDALLDVTMMARAESLTELFSCLDGLVRGVGADDSDALDAALRALDRDEPAAFHLLSSVVVGAYLLSPEVRQAIGYPGQGSNPPSFEQAADDLSDGILDPVIARGPIYVAVPTDENEG